MRHLLVFGMFFGLSLSTFGQTNAYLLNDPVWKIKTYNAHEYPCLKRYTSNYFLGDPQVIDSLEYFPLYERYEMIYDWESPIPPYPFCDGIQTADSLFRGWLRSEGKRMYFNGGFANGDILLYDFDLAVGDTLFNWELIPNDTLVVSAIDSVQTPAGPVTRFWLTGNDYTDFMLEGIGSSVGLIQSMTRPYNVFSTLTCYTRATEKWFPEDAVENCVFYLELSELEKSANNWEIWHDHEFLHVESENGNKIKEWQVLSNTGQKIIHGGNTQSVHCDLRSWNVGVYFVVVAGENGQIARQKIVKL